MGDRQTQQAFTASLGTGESRGAITSAQRLLVLTIPLLLPPLISSLVPYPFLWLVKKKNASKHLQFILITIIFFGLVYDLLVVALPSPPPRFFSTRSGQGVPALFFFFFFFCLGSAHWHKKAAASHKRCHMVPEQTA